MATRSIWKGYLQFSMVTIPIRLYNAVDAGASIHFNQLHQKDNGRVGHDKKCKSCGDVLRSEDIVKGYEYAPDEYVVVTSDDLKSLGLKSTKVLEISGFVAADEFSQTLFDTPYFVGPDGDVAAKGYALLREAIRTSGRMGVGKLALRDREDMVILADHEGGLVLYKVRYPHLIRPISDIPNLELSEVGPEELQLTQHLVEIMGTTLGEVELKDTYQEAVREMIHAKVEGKEVVTVAEDVRPVPDIMVAIRESIAQARESNSPKRNGKSKKPARKAARSKKKAATAKKAAAKRKAA